MVKTKRKSSKLLTVIIVIILGYFTMTPTGSLRAAVLLSGHPVSACTLKISDEPYEASVEDNQTIYSLENPPVEEATDSELVNWVVTKYGPFYFAEYFGWA